MNLKLNNKYELFIGGKMKEELEEYLSKLTCRGCYNHCILTEPGCGKSKIFIKEAIEKFDEKNMD